MKHKIKEVLGVFINASFLENFKALTVTISHKINWNMKIKHQFSPLHTHSMSFLIYSFLLLVFSSNITNGSLENIITRC